MREYSGFTGFAEKITPGLDAFTKAIQEASGGQIWRNGGFNKRRKRGHNNSQSMKGWSIHSTGRAADLSRRKHNGQPGCSRDDMLKLYDWLISVQELIGLEYLADYQYDEKGAAGRGWMCDREEWRSYKPGVISAGGKQWADWCHIELSPEKSAVTDWVDEAMKTFPLGGYVPKIDTASGWVTLRQGDQGDGVVKVQQVLRDGGYKNGSSKKPLLVDGDFGAVTARRVRQYQKKHGLVVDAIVGKQTAGHMQILDK